MDPADDNTVHLEHVFRKIETYGRRGSPSGSPQIILREGWRAVHVITYGYRHVHALLRRQAEKTGRAGPNPKRVYRVMKVHGLLLQRDAK